MYEENHDTSKVYTNENSVNDGSASGVFSGSNEPYRAESAAYIYEPQPEPRELTRRERRRMKKETRKQKRMEKKAQRKGGYFKKILVAASLGIVFGVFSGIAFWGVWQGVELLKGPMDLEVMGESGRDGDEWERYPEVGENKIPMFTGSNSVTVVESAVSDVAEAVMPAMVSIVNNHTIRGNYWGQTFTEQTASSGSGIIIGKTDKELLIASNNHVVEEADKLEVTFIDGTEVEAYIKGLDSDMDLAVIAVPLKDIEAKTMMAITIATLGDSDELKLGEPVIAIGNALGYGQSVTDGIVSALNRKLKMDDGSTRTYIQTNAAINPGNSGGALLNIAGEVIGINTSKIGGSAIEGMGYAIPISSANPIIADLMERQTRNKVDEEDLGYIGVSLQEVTSQHAQMYGMPVGVFVFSVVEGSGAEKAGIIPGDVITEIDGTEITGYENLQRVMQYYAAGDEVTITVMRREMGKYNTYELEVTLGRRPAEK